MTFEDVDGFEIKNWDGMKCFLIHLGDYINSCEPFLLRLQKTMNAYERFYGSKNNLYKVKNYYSRAYFISQKKYDETNRISTTNTIFIRLGSSFFDG